MGSNKTDAELTPPKKLFSLTEDHRKTLAAILAQHQVPENTIDLGSMFGRGIIDDIAPAIEEIVGAEIVADRKAMVIGLLEGLKQSRPGLEYSIAENSVQIRIPE